MRALLLPAMVLVGCRTAPGAAQSCHIEFEDEPAPQVVYAEPTPCDPLEADQRQIHLQPPVLVAEADDGQLLVLDRFGGIFVDDRYLETRVFVLDDETLVQRDGALGGMHRESADAPLYATVWVDDARQAMVRWGTDPLEHIDPTSTEVVMFDEPPAGTTDAERFEQGTPAGVLPECAASSYPLEPLTPRDTVEYLTLDERGYRVLVTMDGRGYDAFGASLFYGPPDAVREYPVEVVGRQRDGGTTTVVFEADGARSELYFPVGCNGPFTLDCEGTISTGGESWVVGVPERGVPVPQGETYLCDDSGKAG